MHFVSLTSQLTDDQKIARLIERGVISVYDFTLGGAVWAKDEDDPGNPDKSYDPVRKTGTEG